MTATTPPPPARLPGFLREILETAARGLLRLDPDARAALGRLQGNVFRLRLVNPDIELFVVPGRDGLSFRAESPDEVTTTLKGSPFALFSLSRAGTEARVPAGHVEISGDVEAGRRLAEILKRLDPDWEEPLAALMGDVAAYELGRVVRGGLAWARDSARRMTENAARFVTDETRDVVSRNEVETFCAAVDRLRDDVERLEARLQRLKGPE